MIGWLLNLIPHRFVVMGAAGAFAFLGGMLIGNHWATKEVVERLELARAEEFSRATMLMAEEMAKLDQELKEAQRRQAVANQRVFAELQKEKQDNDRLRKANEVLAMESTPSDECSLSPRVRAALDYASGASDVPPPDDPISDGAVGAAGEVGEGTALAERLTCEQLARSYVELSRWGKRGWTKYDAWQAFWESIHEGSQ